LPVLIAYFTLQNAIYTIRQEDIAEAYDSLVELANSKAAKNSISDLLNPPHPAFFAPTSSATRSSNIRSATTIISVAENMLASCFIAVPYALQYFAYSTLEEKFGFGDVLVLVSLGASTVIRAGFSVLIGVRMSENR
jgi:hypothetical protein